MDPIPSLSQWAPTDVIWKTLVFSLLQMSMARYVIIKYTTVYPPWSEINSVLQAISNTWRDRLHRNDGNLLWVGKKRILLTTLTILQTAHFLVQWMKEGSFCSLAVTSPRTSWFPVWRKGWCPIGLHVPMGPHLPYCVHIALKNLRI